MGKPRPPHVVEAIRRAKLGSHQKEETRRRMSRTHRKRGTLVPGTIPWTAEEDEWVKTIPAEEAAKRTGRSLSAVYPRRWRLGCRTAGDGIERGRGGEGTFSDHRVFCRMR
jgi:hypothetical protein